MSSDNDSILRQYGAKYGLILGGILLALSIASVYFLAETNPSAMTMFFSLFFTGFVLKLVLAVVFVLWLRRTVGGYWSLKQAVTGIFFMFYMSFLINYIGNDIVFSHLIDPVTVHKANEKTIDAYRIAQHMANKPEKEIDASVKDMQEAFREGNTITPGSVLETLIRNVLLIFLVSLIFGALFKREPPLFTRNTDVEQE